MENSQYRFREKLKEHVGLDRAHRLHRLEGQAVQQERQAEIARNMAENSQTLYEVSPEQLGLRGNSIRLPIGSSGFDWVNHNLDFDGVNNYGELSPDRKYDVINTLSVGGDPLCSKIMNYLGTGKLPFPKLSLVDSEVPAKLLKRTMTEQEYYGILGGEVPFTRDLIYGKEHFLEGSESEKNEQNVSA